MKIPDFNNSVLNQDDFVALEAQLKLHAMRLSAILSANEGEAIQPPKMIAGDIFGNILLQVNHISELEHRIGAESPQFQFPANIKTCGEARPAPKFPGDSIGNDSNAGFKESGASPSKKPTMTERVLAARGVKSLDELSAKMSGMSHEEKMCSARKLKIAAAAVGFFALCFASAFAQSTVPFDTAGNHVLRNGGTNSIAASSADGFADYGQPFPCNSFIDCGIGVSFRTVTPYSGGTVTLLVTNGVLGLDGKLLMDSAPDFVQVIPLNSTNFTSIAIYDGSLTGNRFSLGIVNSNGVTLTNETVSVLFKLVKHGAVDASR